MNEQRPPLDRRILLTRTEAVPSQRQTIGAGDAERLGRIEQLVERYKRALLANQSDVKQLISGLLTADAGTD